MPEIKKTVSAAVSAVLFLVCCVLIAGMVFTMGTDEKPWEQLPKANLGSMTDYDMYISDLIAGAMDNVVPVKKIYRLAEDVTVAPEPDRELYGSSKDPMDAVETAEAAMELLEFEDIFWDPGKELKANSDVQWYLDETIFVLNWKQVINNVVYTFMEVKLAHPSQFRRYFVEDTFACPVQQTPSMMAASVKSVAAMSGDFYKFRKIGIVVYKGEFCRAGGEEVDSCFVDANGDLHFVRRGTLADDEAIIQYIEENDIQFSLSFGPTLIEDGELVVPDRYILGEIDDRYPRAAICQLGQCHYLMVTANAEGPGTTVPALRPFADVLYDMGIDNAYTLDGGQTCTIIINDKVINSVLTGRERYVSDIIYFATAIPEREEDV